LAPVHVLRHHGEVSDDWFRSQEWTEEAQADFERRLARARAHNRPQYLRLKGLSLCTAGEISAARELWERVLSDPELRGFEAATVTEHLADSYSSSEPARAASLYRRVSGLSPTLSGTSGIHHIKLARLLLTTGTDADLQEAGQLLEWWVANAHVPFQSAHFEWNVVYVKWAQRLGDHESARAGAQRALELTGRGPVFSRHPTVGLVDADEATVKWLRSVAESG